MSSSEPISHAPIAFFAHDHGDGHLHRVRAIAAGLYRPHVIFTAHEAADSDRCVRLPRVHAATSALAETGGLCPPTLHDAPLGVAALRQRAAILTRWLADAAPDILVVDGSVEVAMLARLASQPTIIVRTHGARLDAAHAAAYRSADYLLAPFSACLDQPETPCWVRDKTFYAGLIAPTSNPGRQPAPQPDPHARTVAVVLGRPGDPLSLDTVARAAERARDWHWRVLGADTRATATPPNLELVATTDLAGHLRHSHVVLANAGAGVIAEAALARRPMIVVPAPRPHDEQTHRATRLTQLALVDVVHDPARTTDWARRLERVAESAPAWEIGEPDGAARRAARFIEAATARIRVTGPT